jgi:hypothetical protein
MTSIYLFNASALPINLSIRAGDAISINGTNRTTLWRPSFPATQPSWGGVNPTAGEFGFGDNPVLVSNGLNSVPLTISIPTTVLPTTSLQIYFYYAPPSNENPEPAAYWVGLNDALPFGGQVKSITALKRHE